MHETQYFHPSKLLCLKLFSSIRDFGSWPMSSVPGINVDVVLGMKDTGFIDKQRPEEYISRKYTRVFLEDICLNELSEE